MRYPAAGRWSTALYTTRIHAPFLNGLKSLYPFLHVLFELFEIHKEKAPLLSNLSRQKAGDKQYDFVRVILEEHGRVILDSPARINCCTIALSPKDFVHNLYRKRK